jgi:hypothetical protein
MCHCWIHTWARGLPSCCCQARERWSQVPTAHASIVGSMDGGMAVHWTALLEAGIFSALIAAADLIWERKRVPRVRRPEDPKIVRPSWPMSRSETRPSGSGRRAPVVSLAAYARRRGRGVWTRSPRRPDSARDRG